MWYEILPFMGICVGVAGAVQFLHAPFTFFTEKGAFRPKIYSRHWFDNTGFRRDINLTGSVYRPNGLEAIPDED